MNHEWDNSEAVAHAVVRELDEDEDLEDLDEESEEDDDDFFADLDDD